MEEKKNRIASAGKWALGVSSAVLIFAAQTKQEEAVSNISGWLKWIGIDRVPAAFAATGIDTWFTIFGVTGLLLTSWWMLRRSQRRWVIESVRKILPKHLQAQTEPVAICDPVLIPGPSPIPNLGLEQAKHEFWTRGRGQKDPIFSGWELIDPLELWQAAYLFAGLHPPEKAPKDDPRITAWMLKFRQCILDETLPVSPSLSAMRRQHADFEKRFGVPALLLSGGKYILGQSFSINNISNNCKVARSDLKQFAETLNLKPGFLFGNDR